MPQVVIPEDNDAIDSSRLAGAEPEVQREAINWLRKWLKGVPISERERVSVILLAALPRDPRELSSVSWETFLPIAAREALAGVGAPVTYDTLQSPGPRSGEDDFLEVESRCNTDPDIPLLPIYGLSVPPHMVDISFHSSMSSGTWLVSPGGNNIGSLDKSLEAIFPHLEHDSTESFVKAWNGSNNSDTPVGISVTPPAEVLIVPSLPYPSVISPTEIPIIVDSPVDKLNATIPIKPAARSPASARRGSKASSPKGAGLAPVRTPVRSRSPQPLGTRLSVANTGGSLSARPAALSARPGTASFPALSVNTTGLSATMSSPSPEKRLRPTENERRASIGLQPIVPGRERRRSVGLQPMFPTKERRRSTGGIPGGIPGGISSTSSSPMSKGRSVMRMVRKPTSELMEINIKEAWNDLTLEERRRWKEAQRKQTLAKARKDAKRIPKKTPLALEATNPDLVPYDDPVDCTVFDVNARPKGHIDIKGELDVGVILCANCVTAPLKGFEPFAHDELSWFISSSKEGTQQEIQLLEDIPEIPITTDLQGKYITCKFRPSGVFYGKQVIGDVISSTVGPVNRLSESQVSTPRVTVGNIVESELRPGCDIKLPNMKKPYTEIPRWIFSDPITDIPKLTPVKGIGLFLKQEHVGLKVSVLFTVMSSPAMLQCTVGVIEADSSEDEGEAYAYPVSPIILPTMKKNSRKESMRRRASSSHDDDSVFDASLRNKSFLKRKVSTVATVSDVHINDAESIKSESEASEQYIPPEDGETEAETDASEDTVVSSINMPVIATIPTPEVIDSDAVGEAPPIFENQIPNSEEDDNRSDFVNTVPLAVAIPQQSPTPEVHSVKASPASTKSDDILPPVIIPVDTTQYNSKLTSPEVESSIPEALSSWSISEREAEVTAVTPDPIDTSGIARPRPKRRFRPGQAPPKSEGPPTLFEAPVASTPVEEITATGSLSVSPSLTVSAANPVEHVSPVAADKYKPRQLPKSEAESVELEVKPKPIVVPQLLIDDNLVQNPENVTSPTEPSVPILSPTSDGDLSECSVMDTFRVINDVGNSSQGYSPVPQLNMANIARTQNVLRKQLEQSLNKNAAKAPAPPIKPPNKKPLGGALAFKPRIGGVALKNPYDKNSWKKKPKVPTTFAPHKRSVSPTSEVAQNGAQDGKSTPDPERIKSPPPENRSPGSQAEAKSQETPAPVPVTQPAKAIPVFEPPAKRRPPPASTPKKVAKDGGGCNCTIM